MLGRVSRDHQRAWNIHSGLKLFLLKLFLLKSYTISIRGGVTFLLCLVSLISRLGGYLGVLPYHGTPPISGKTDPFTGFSTQYSPPPSPLSRVLFPLDSLSREHYGDPPFPFFSFLFFSFIGPREICVRIWSLPSRGPITDIQ